MAEPSNLREIAQLFALDGKGKDDLSVSDGLRFVRAMMTIRDREMRVKLIELAELVARNQT